MGADVTCSSSGDCGAWRGQVGPSVITLNLEG